MAKIYDDKISISFDVYGCPQRCKHCWLGHPEHFNMNIDKVLSSFKKVKEEQQKNKYYGAKIEYIGVDFREPHFGKDYKELYNKVDKINGCSLEVKKDFELISLWRLVRDEGYINWIKERGIKRAQLKVFGLKETNNFFYGRKGAHEDLLKGTNILLENGIIPRWQVFYNKKGINELDDVLKLTKELEIWNRVKVLGEEFNIHAFTYDSVGAGFNNHKYRIDKSDKSKIPLLLWKKSKEHFDEYNLKTEGELTKEILDGTEENTRIQQDHWLWFFVTSDWSVYPNFMGIAPWWKLGNLKKDSWKTILDNYKYNNNLGLKIMAEKPVKELAKVYGDINGSKIYMDKNELIDYWIEKYCRINYK